MKSRKIIKFYGMNFRRLFTRIPMGENIIDNVVRERERERERGREK